MRVLPSRRGCHQARRQWRGTGPPDLAEILAVVLAVPTKHSFKTAHRCTAHKDQRSQLRAPRQLPAIATFQKLGNAGLARLLPVIVRARSQADVVPRAFVAQGLCSPVRRRSTHSAWGECTVVPPSKRGWYGQCWPRLRPACARSRHGEEASLGKPQARVSAADHRGRRTAASTPGSRPETLPTCEAHGSFPLPEVDVGERWALITVAL